MTTAMHASQFDQSAETCAWSSLQRHVAERSPAAFGRVVKQHIDWVHASARRLTGDAHLADDVTQAVFLLLHRKADTVTSEAHLTGWLFNAVRFAAKDAVRADRRRQRHEALAAIPADQPAPQLSNEPSPELAERIDEALATLREPDRQLIILRFYRDLATAQVAQTLSISTEAAKKRIARALARLRQVLSRAGLSISAAALPAMLSGGWLAPAAPAGVVAACSALASAAPAPTALLLANAAARMMAVTKLKLACVLMGTIVLLASVAWLAARQWAPPAPPNAAPPALAPDLIRLQPPQLSGEMITLLVHWSALVDVPTLQRIVAASQPVQTESVAYAAARMDSEHLRQLLRDAGDGVLYLGVVEPNDGNRWFHPGQFRPREGQRETDEWYDAGAIRPGREPIHDIFDSHVRGTLFFQTAPDEARLLLDLQVTIRRSRFRVQPPLEGHVRFDAAVAGGQLLMFHHEANGLIERIPGLAGQPVAHLLIWQAVLMPVEHSPHVRNRWRHPQWWLDHGQQHAAELADQVLAWEAHALAHPSDAVEQRWSRQLPDGRVLKLEAIARQQIWPLLWWDPEGNPAVAAGDELYGGIPPARYRVALYDAAGEEVGGVTGGWYGFEERALSVGVGAGPWERVGRISTGEPLQIQGRRYLLEQQSTRPERAIMRLEYDPDADHQVAMLAVDRAGREHGRDQARDDWVFTNTLGTSSAHLFLDLPLDQIDHFVLLRRPIQWERFENIALQPRLAEE